LLASKKRSRNAATAQKIILKMYENRKRCVRKNKPTRNVPDLLLIKTIPY